MVLSYLSTKVTGYRIVLPENKEELSGLKKKYFKEPLKSSEHQWSLENEAARLFIANEAQVIGALKGELLVKNQGHLQDILVAKWMRQEIIGIYVKAGLDHGIVLQSRIYEGDNYNGHWTFEWRGDLANIADGHPKGYLYNANGIALKNLPAITGLMNKFSDSLEGYKLVAKSRR